MSCPHEAELLASGPGPELREHAARCAQCAEAIELLEGARGALAEPPPALSPESRARMWRTIQAAEQRRGAFRRAFDLRPFALASALASAVIIVLSIETAPPLQLHAGELRTTAGLLESGDDVEVGVNYHAQAPTLISRTGLEIRTGEETELSFGSDVETILLRSGEVSLDVAPLPAEATLAVITPLARVEVIGTRFSVVAEPAATRVEVEHGVVKVTPLGQGAAAPFELRAGESHRIEAFDARAAAQRADELRRAGRAEEAAAAYQAIAADPRAEGYAEEMLLRRARILFELGRGAQALAEIEAAGRRFRGGVLAPERAVLAADVLAARGAMAEAADVLAEIDDALATEALSARRLEVASALIDRDPARARALAVRVAASPVSEALRARAETLAAAARRSK